MKILSLLTAVQCVCVGVCVCVCVALHLLSQGLHRRDVYTAALHVVQQHPQDSKLGTYGLPAARGRAHKHVVIAVVQSVEHCRSTDTEMSRLAGKQGLANAVVLVVTLAQTVLFVSRVL